MKHYANGCARSEIKVTPSNWNTRKASCKKKWKIYYRYYDPVFKGTDLWGKQIQIRGMNDKKDIVGRQAKTKILLADEIRMLDEQGYNPITNTFYTASNGMVIEEITPSMPFIEALRKAHPMLTCCEEMKIDVGRIIEALEAAAGKLYDQTIQKPYISLKVSQVSRKHYIYLFKQCGKDNPNFSAYRQNKYRTSLMMLYKKLLAVEAVEADPISSIPIEKTGVKKKPKLLSETERLIIDTNLRAWDYPFWRYMRIFFRSGCRSSELLDLKPMHVDIEAQEFTITVRKGKEYREDIRPIADDVLHLWVELLEEARPGDYLFGTSFKPGSTRQYRDAPTKKWNKYVTNDPGQYDPLGQGWGLGIKKQFYKLKHLNADIIAGKIDIKAAAAADGHADIATTKKHYAINEEVRERERLKRTRVDF
jgi:integrase